MQDMVGIFAWLPFSAPPGAGKRSRILDSIGGRVHNPAAADEPGLSISGSLHKWRAQGMPGA
jgi:hypothetical protein